MSSNLMWITTGIIILFVFCGACTTSQENIITNDMASAIPAVETPIPIPAPTVAQTTTPMPVRMITVERTPVPVQTEEDWVPDWTPEPTVIPTANPDITRQNFTPFKNWDFMAVYPEDWAVVTQAIELSDTTLYKQDTWKKDGRLVTFSSQDGNISMNVFTYDFITPDRFVYRPTIDTVRQNLGKKYPNASIDSSVYEFQYKKSDRGVEYVQYDIIFSSSSEYYPYAYTEQLLFTYNHMYIVQFVAKTGNLYEYNDLKYKMLTSFVTEGTQGGIWWM